jgi:UDP-N-acetylglucosamine--N-acetylmuramyl-(pentapeptide) pyrophosphoryl-undecaprenol N-acetylglucosamine transferase
LKIIISGGGTGGHIFPAIAIADAIRVKLPDAQILFVGAKGRMEMTRVPEAGYAINGLWISGFQRKLTTENLLFPFKVASSLLKARTILRSFKPDVVIGVGGYASGPTLRMAVSLGIKTLIQEQNSFPGITNRLLGKKVNRICVAYDSMERWFPKEKTSLTGNPLREKAINIAGKKKTALEYFGFDEGQLVLLIVGGSQGAKAINEAIAQNIKVLINSNMHIIWQTGESFLPVAQKIIADNFTNLIHPYAFIKEMEMAYAAADLIVSRAGAMSISEISAVGKPAIFVPLPTAAEDHQTKNAFRLVNKNAAILIRNDEAVEKLANAILKLSNDQNLRNELSNNIRQFALPNATDLIVKEVLKLADR